MGKNNKKLTFNEVVERSRKIHGDNYDYVESTFTNTSTKMGIICHKINALGKEHGIFWQTPNKHIIGKRGCPFCKGMYKTTELIIAEFKQIHGNDYIYDKVEYKGNNAPVEIICRRCGRTFKQTHSHHLSGEGCPHCKLQRSWDKRNNKFTLEKFLKLANEFHSEDEKLDYSKVIIKGYMKPIVVICHKIGKDGKEHGEFTTTPNNFVGTHNHCGCPKCNKSEKYSIDVLVDILEKIHNGKYKYPNIEKEYISLNSKITAVCPKHGPFPQRLSHHMSGCGCPVCNESRLERDIRIMLDKNDIRFLYRHHESWLGKQEIDFYLPDYNIAIECQGI